jgi:hypothetical protein
MKHTTWQADGYEIEVDGVSYYVNANFEWNRQSVDHRHDYSRGYSGQGQDLIADVPVAVEEIEIWGADEFDAVLVSVKKEIAEKVLDLFANSEQGTRNAEWGRWM